MIPVDENGWNVRSYTARILTDSSNIFYYTLTQTKHKKGSGNQWDSYEEVLDSFKNQARYAAFQDQFKQAYADTIHTTDLFLTDIVYGDGCGFASQPPEYLNQLNSFIIFNNIKAINKWLHSANAEKQLYALRGYKALMALGYKPTVQELRLIKLVRQKKGFVNYCGGCIFWSKTFADVVAEIDSAGDKYLLPAGIRKQ